MTTSVYYTVLFSVSLLLTAAHMFIWRKHDDVHITLIFTLIPIVNLGYMLLGRATTLSVALTAMKIIYMGGSFLQLIIVLAIFSLCKIPLNRWIRLLLLLLTVTTYLSVLTVGEKNWFYTEVSYQQTDGFWRLNREYGPLHTVFYCVLVVYFALSFGVILYALLRKNQVSRKLLLLLFLPQLVCMLAHFLGREIMWQMELLPAGYVFAQMIYLRISRRIHLYDVTDTVIEAMVESGETGFIIFDPHFHYLGSSGMARDVLPGLSGLTVDLPLYRNPEMESLLMPWLEKYREAPGDQEANEHHYKKEDRVYQISVGPLLDKKSMHGYRMVITDDTIDQAYIQLKQEKNEELQQRVEEQTDHIRRMNENLVMSMAVMVESRDNSTGGHIRRTSDGVRMLMDAMNSLESPPPGYDMTEEFTRRMIKAAPMHDLGKIAVDDEILRKKGRFTPEEFEKMKRHAPEGARIVHAILKDTDDQLFHLLAENVAHYHHERWDGSGYPDGLRGGDIPPEARIMAVADVYDALVSKRVYKERMSFEKAHEIIMEGMGIQFDPALEPAFLKAEPSLQAYYSRVWEEEGDAC